jgi:glycosyltransferase involved in cell wall biosynthesis
MNLSRLKNALTVRLKPLASWTDNRLNLMRDANGVQAFDFSSSDVQQSKELMAKYSTIRPHVRRINWLVPHVKHPLFAGVHTILRFADYLSREKAIQNKIIIYNSSGFALSALREKIEATFAGLAGCIQGLDGAGAAGLPASDITIATCWQSAYLLLKVRNTAGKFYFVQDFEPLFYPAGVTYGLAEATYRLGYSGIANTESLGALLRTSYGMNVKSFQPAVDPEIFCPNPNRQSEPVKIFFYGRPGNPRNGFILGIEALKKCKEQFKEHIQIVSAGGCWNPSDFGAKGTVENLGVLPTIKDVATLYRNCHIGLIFMFTKHPSYQPIEMMASGVAVIANDNAATKWFLRDGTNSLLVEPTATSVSEGVRRLIVDAQFRNQLAFEGLRTAGQTSWAAEFESVYRFLVGEVDTEMDNNPAKSVQDLHTEGIAQATEV